MVTFGKQSFRPGPEELREENRRIRILRFMTDLTQQRLFIERMTLCEARQAVVDLGKVAERMFPGKKSVFELVIAPRMERVIKERFGGDMAAPYN